MNKAFFVICLFFALIAGLCLPKSAHAHWADMAAMELNLQARSAQATLTLPTPFFSEVDLNHNGSLEDAEIKNNLRTIESRLAEHIRLQVNHEAISFKISPAPAGSGNAAAPIKGMTILRLDWHWERDSNQLALVYDLFPAEAPLAHCLVSVQRGDQLSALVFDRQHSQQLLIEPSLGAQILSFTQLGLEHILTGYDHLLFLLALLLASRRLNYLLKIVTAFTLAHSITLSLAVLNIVQAPSRWIESLIAVSIIYVVLVEVLWKKQETPWYIVSGFGLIHGLGFANLLREMSLPTSQLTTALISFNLGIEVGQICVVLMFWGLLSLLSKKAVLNPYVQTSCAVLILLVSGYWFVTRAFLGA